MISKVKIKSIALLAIIAFSSPARASSFPGIPESLLVITQPTPHLTHEIREPFSLTSCGKTLIGIYHKPLTPPPPGGYPTVILFHGFRGSKLGHGNCYIKVAEGITAKGMAAFRVDMAGCGDSEGVLETISLQEFMMNSDDIVAFVAKHPEVDVNRIGIAGFSFGCHISLQAAKKYDQKLLNVKAISLWAPIADGTLLLKELTDTLTANVPGKSLDTIVAMGKEFGFLDLPLTLVEGDIENICSIHDYLTVSLLKRSTKILHLQGGADILITSRQRKIFLHNSPKNVEFAFFPDVGHGFGGSSQSSAVVECIASHFYSAL